MEVYSIHLYLHFVAPTVVEEVEAAAVDIVVAEVTAAMEVATVTVVVGMAEEPADTAVAEVVTGEGLHHAVHLHRTTAEVVVVAAVDGLEGTIVRALHPTLLVSISQNPIVGIFKFLLFKVVS